MKYVGNEIGATRSTGNIHVHLEAPVCIRRVPVVDRHYSLGGEPVDDKGEEGDLRVGAGKVDQLVNKARHERGVGAYGRDAVHEGLLVPRARLDVVHAEVGRLKHARPRHAQELVSKRGEGDEGLEQLLGLVRRAEVVCVDDDHNLGCNLVLSLSRS